jgi:hypothetical protein
VEELALPVDVEAASPLAGVGVRGIGTGGEVEVLVVTFGLVGFDAGAADLLDEEVTDTEGGIANHFGGQAPAGLVREESIGGVYFLE